MEPDNEVTVDNAGLDALQNEASPAPEPGKTEAPSLIGQPKRRGRPPGSGRKKTPPAATPPLRSSLDGPAATGGAAVIPPEMIRALIRVPYDLAAGKMGEHWRLSEAEIETMLPAHIELANQYLPDWLREHAALYTVLACHALFIVGRVQITLRMKREDEERAARPWPSQRTEPEEATKSYGEPLPFAPRVVETPHEGPPLGPAG